MNLRGTTLTAAFAATFAGLVVAGCGGGDEKTTSTAAAAKKTTATATAAPEDAARTTARTFLSALASGNNGTTEEREQACASLSDEARAAIEAVGVKVSATGCVSTLLTIGKLAGNEQWEKTKAMTIDVTTSGDTATATYAAPNDGSQKSIDLVKSGDTWTIQTLPQ